MSSAASGQIKLELDILAFKQIDMSTRNATMNPSWCLPESLKFIGSHWKLTGVRSTSFRRHGVDGLSEVNIGVFWRNNTGCVNKISFATGSIPLIHPRIFIFSQSNSNSDICQSTHLINNVSQMTNDVVGRSNQKHNDVAAQNSVTIHSEHSVLTIVALESLHTEAYMFVCHVETRAMIRAVNLWKEIKFEHESPTTNLLLVLQ